MKSDGDNILLSGSKGGISSGPKKEFKDTEEGKKRIDGCFVAFDGASNNNDNAILPRDGKYIVAI